LCLLFLTFLLAPRPAQAQADRNWNAQPCDAQGNLLPNPQSDGNGFYDLTGPQSGTLSHTYPMSMVNPALAYPNLYGDYLTAAQPLGIGIQGGGGKLGPPSVTVSDPSSPDQPNNRVGVYTPDFAYASNDTSDGVGSYSIDAAHGGPSSGPINGSVTADLSGQLVGYFKMTWYGSGPAPDHVDFLLSTWVYAQASADYESTQQTSGLSATAKATIDAFKETASASAGGGASSAGGLHLVRAAVDPKTGIAEVYVNGTAHWELSNTVAYQVRNPSVPLGGRGDYTYIGPAVASGGSFVRAGAKEDSRDVAIGCSTIEDSYYKGSYDSQHGTDRYQHLRDPITGAIVTDSAVTYQNESTVGLGGASGTGTAQGWQANNIALTANAAGFNSPTYQWSLSGPSQASLTNPITNPVNYSLLEADSSKFPLSGTVKVTVTDSDGASAANTFGITWHLPYEVNAPPLSPVYSKSPLGGPRVGPVPDGQTLLVQATKQQEIDWGATIDGASAIAAGTGQEEIAGGLEILGALAKVTSWKTDVGPENSYNGATNGPTTWSDAGNNNNEIYGGGNLPAGLVGNSKGWQLCNMYIYQYAHYKDTSWYADGYNVHGYDGNSQHILHVHGVDGVYDEFVFVQYKSGIGIPIPPPVPPTHVL